MCSIVKRHSSIQMSGQNHTKDAPHSFFAFDFNPPTVCLDDKLAVKKTDPQSLLLGGSKGPKQGFFDEMFGHAAAIVAEGEHNPAVLLRRCHSNRALAVDCIVGIQDQVSQHLLQLLPID